MSNLMASMVSLTTFFKYLFGSTDMLVATGVVVFMGELEGISIVFAVSGP